MKYLIALALVFFAYNVTAIESERDGKFLSMFNIVRFPNDHCDGGGSRNGTCYTKEECENKGGTNDGSCANGYGVCCTFVVNCGASLSENNTYFESDGDEKSHCSIQVCKAKTSIVQLRLDFINFAIAGPQTDNSAAQAKILSGNVVGGAAAAGNPASLASRCLTDIFSVSNPGGPSPPQICGSNTDAHMYVDMGAECIDLTFQLTDQPSFDPSWNIRITQYDSNYDNLAPFGCTQYFWKEDSDSDGKGSFQSYNYGSGYHLANQNQVICIRREEDKTKICYSVASAFDIAISGTQHAEATYCGGYKNDGDGKTADALIIQSLVKNTANSDPVGYSNVCGQQGFGTGGAADLTTNGAKTVCSKALPFIVTFKSDAFEQVDEVAAAGNTGSENIGFKIFYEQS